MHQNAAVYTNSCAEMCSLVQSQKTKKERGAVRLGRSPETEQRAYYTFIKLYVEIDIHV
jgi:hypothetical protein